jgi:peptidoglycan/LPS O-acetylase OafA/YrhL
MGTASRATLILAIALAPAWVQRPFVSRAARWLAQRSYGLYVMHGLVLTVCAGVIGLRADGSAVAAAAWAGVVVPVSLGCASLSSRYIERPAARWARAKTGRSAPRSPEPQPIPAALTAMQPGP